MDYVLGNSLVMLLVALVSYLLGSIPFGLVITKLLGLGDLRAIGSGNIGATNVLRTGNKGAALATLLLDAGKGGIAVLWARWAFGEDGAAVAALFSFLGHLYPVWLGFKGGKGVATFLGTLIALSWPVGILACLTWLVVAGISRISSLSALVAVVSAPLWMWLVTALESALVVASVMAALVWWRHRPNIARLLAGTEPKIGKKG